MTENKGKEGFTLALALVDALPVLFFSGSMLVIAAMFDSSLFIAGAVLCVIAGLGKVLWKVVLATAKKDVPVLSKQFRVTMPLGFVLMVISAVIGRSKISFSGILSALVSVPSVFFFAAFILLMGAMSVMAKKLDQNDAKSNWKEQITNALAQGCFFAGLLILYLK